MASTVTDAANGGQLCHGDYIDLTDDSPRDTSLPSKLPSIAPKRVEDKTIKKSVGQVIRKTAFVPPQKSSKSVIKVTKNTWSDFKSKMSHVPGVQITNDTCIKLSSQAYEKLTSTGYLSKDGIGNQNIVLVDGKANAVVKNTNALEKLNENDGIVTSKTKQVPELSKIQNSNTARNFNTNILSTTKRTNAPPLAKLSLKRTQNTANTQNFTVNLINHRTSNIIQSSTFSQTQSRLESFKIQSKNSAENKTSQISGNKIAAPGQPQCVLLSGTQTINVHDLTVEETNRQIQYYVVGSCDIPAADVQDCYLSQDVTPEQILSAPIITDNYTIIEPDSSNSDYIGAANLKQTENKLCESPNIIKSSSVKKNMPSQKSVRVKLNTTQGDVSNLKFPKITSIKTVKTIKPVNQTLRTKNPKPKVSDQKRPLETKLIKQMNRNTSNTPNVQINENRFFISQFMDNDASFKMCEMFPKPTTCDLETTIEQIDEKTEVCSDVLEPSILIEDSEDEDKSDPLFESSKIVDPKPLKLYSISSTVTPVDIKKILKQSPKDEYKLKATEIAVDRCKAHKPRGKKLISDPLEKGFGRAEKNKKAACIKQLKTIIIEENAKIKKHMKKVKHLNEEITARSSFETLFLEPSTSDCDNFYPETIQCEDESVFKVEDVDFPSVADTVEVAKNEVANLNSKNLESVPTEALDMIKKGLELIKNWSQSSSNAPDVSKLLNGRQSVKPSTPSKTDKKAPKRERTTKLVDLLRPVTQTLLDKTIDDVATGRLPAKQKRVHSPPKIPKEILGTPSDGDDLFIVRKVDILNKSHMVIQTQYNTNAKGAKRGRKRKNFAT